MSAVIDINFLEGKELEDGVAKLESVNAQKRISALESEILELSQEPFDHKVDIFANDLKEQYCYDRKSEIQSESNQDTFESPTPMHASLIAVSILKIINGALAKLKKGDKVWIPKTVKDDGMAFTTWKMSVVEAVYHNDTDDERSNYVIINGEPVPWCHFEMPHDFDDPEYSILPNIEHSPRFYESLFQFRNVACVFVK